MLTGGRSIEHQHNFLKNYVDANRFDFYFTDERCVPLDDMRSNYHSHRDYLSKNYSEESVFNRIEADAIDLDSACSRYNLILPNCIDLLFLSLGDDGHIASIFPNSRIVNEFSRKVMVAINPYTLERRITITPAVIKNAKQIIVFALGKKKREFYKDVVLKEPDNVLAIPARIALKGEWIFDIG